MTKALLIVGGMTIFGGFYQFTDPGGYGWIGVILVFLGSVTVWAGLRRRRTSRHGY